MRGARPLRVLVAPDSFKHSLSARRAAEAIAAGVREARPDAELRLMPLADGGEGTIRALRPAGALVREALVSGPLGAPRRALWASLGRTAVIETAEAAGLELVSRPSPRTARLATTRGVGQLVRAALDAGFREIVVAAGGTATSDGGAGALFELGLQARDGRGAPVTAPEELGAVRTVRFDGLDPRLADTRFLVASDVSSPLLGPSGAARLFSPQKGADPATVELLEARLAAWARILERATGRALRELPGAGAAGGLPAGLAAVAEVRVRSGLAWLSEVLDLPGAVRDADLVIVGEGRLDRQSLRGKAPVALAGIARRAGIRTVALCGRLELSREQLHAVGISAALPIAGDEEDSVRAMAEAPERLRCAAARILAMPAGARVAGAEPRP